MRLALFFLILNSFSSAIAAAAEPPKPTSAYNYNKIVAVVNKQIITQHELEISLKEMQNSLSEQKVDNIDQQKLAKQVLNDMIMRKILLENADRYGIKVNDNEINQQIDKILQNKKISLDNFKKDLDTKNYSFDRFYKDIKEQLIIEKLTQREVSQKVFVSNDEVMRIYNTQVYQNKEDYHLASISIHLPENATADIVSRKEGFANSIYQRLHNGEDFNKLTTEYSEDSNALRAGDIGWKSNLSMPPPLSEQLKTMKVGEITPVMKFANNFYIFKILEIRQHNLPDLVRQYHVKHILIKVSEYVSEQEALDKITRIRNSLLKDKKSDLNKSFENAARSYSQDTSSVNGGDIGWIAAGDTVANFENTVLKAKIGEISEPVRTVFGWHLIQVIAIRNNDMHKDKEIADIKQEIYQAKWQQAYQNWLDSLRNSSYIKYLN